MFKAYGTLRFGKKEVVLDIDQSIIEYYYSLIPKYYHPNRQKYSGHITIIRGFEKPLFKLSMFNGHKCLFEYDKTIHYEKPYFFLNANCRKAEFLRMLSGLPRFRFDEISKRCFHITIANTKARL